MEAKAVIERDEPKVAVIILAKGDYHYPNFCCKRVLLYVNEDAKCIAAIVPEIG
ncbi:hypothetical protein GIB67_026941 [Kingdonia uniflora]|uniref:Proteinase inhibitor n=1 Tax=Kingdonia uniflora TaxID=39325 RepID=A0A7J7P1C4_9MAGN|nr:hypothetical protein GIB67_026941 [Kingdonia uniflora]